MKNKLPCPVVRDLLPSYLEGLTEPETEELVRDHLAACSECAAHCKAMQDSDEIDSPPPQQQKEVDYLKKVRRSSRKKILLTAVLVALVLTAGIWTQLCWIGSPLKPEDYYYHAVEEMPGTLRVVVSMNGSAQAFAHKKVINEDGVVKITARKVLASPWNRAGYEEFYLQLDDVNEIWVMDQPIWKDGLVIEQKTNELFETNISYRNTVSV